MRRLLPLVLALTLSAAAETVSVQVLATTDMHGNILPYDYYTQHEVQRGLAKLATIIKSEREKNPNTVLIDCGDTIQGTPLESFYQAHALEPGASPDPMMLSMNTLGYDAMALGNHEFNFGLERMERARKTAKFPWLSANTSSFTPYTVKTIAGVRVAIIGLTTPLIPNWEKKENYAGYSWTDPVKAAADAVERLKHLPEPPDVIVVALHSGLERDPKTGELLPGGRPQEDVAYRLSTEVPGIDVLFYGHTHQEFGPALIGKTLALQPKNWGASLGAVDIELERKDGGKWHIAKRTGRIIPVTAQIAVDAQIAAIAKPYHEAAESWLNQPVTRSAATLDARRSRIEDTAVVDAVQQAQLFYAKADVSFASSFNPRARIKDGPVTVRDLASIYLYDNELYAVEGNGRVVREALENAARFYRSCPDAACTGPLLNREVMGYNYDMAQGVAYEVDLAEPLGHRIKNLRYRGKPLADDQPLRLAINNYRSAGSGGYTMFRNLPVVWRSYDGIRELLIEYYSAPGHTLPTEPDRNWRIVPEAALTELGAEIDTDTRRSAGK
jgi:2',3'-cyclic-nucleotide 2'-phosphodiesterase / 3'-nucleotidase